MYNTKTVTREDLKTNFSDDILLNGDARRKYNIINNEDGTVSFEDVTEYEVEGDKFDSKTLNEITTRINDIGNETVKEDLSVTNITSENATIEKLVASSGSIGNWEFSSTGGLSAKYRETFSFSQADMDKVQAYISGTSSLTDAEFKKYDFLKTGVIDATTYIYIRNIFYGNSPNYMDHTFTINPNDPNNFIKQIRVYNGKTYTSGLSLPLLAYENQK